MTALCWLILGVALAQEPAAGPEAPPDPDPEPEVVAPAQEEQDLETDGVEATINEEGVYEITVYGPDAIREARKAMVERMGDIGWEQVRSRNGDLVFRGPSSWMGKAILDRDGYLTFSVPAVAFQSAQTEGSDVATQSETDQSQLAKQSSGGDYQGLSRDPGSGVGAGASFSLFPGKKKTSAVQEQVLDAVQPELDAYRSAIQDTAFREQLARLPDRLDALWWDGTPLEPSAAPLESFEERRAAVLEYWATRADTPQGRDVCRDVEAWVREVMMNSEHPMTAEEQARANTLAQETHGRTLAVVAE